MKVWICCLALTLSILAAPVWAQDKEKTIYPVAVLSFAERGKDVKELGPKVADLLFARLASDPELFLVDRADLKKVLDELELNQSGLIDPQKAVKVGHMTGAKILVAGSVLQVDANLYLIAKIIGTETSRVLGASVKGNIKDALDELVVELSKEVAKTIQKRSSELVAKPATRADRLATLKDRLGKGRRPSVFIQVSERHAGQSTADPAAETELAWLCRELGFTVIDRASGNKSKADVLIAGEGLSEFAARHGNLVSVKARLEVKAVDQRTGQVLAIDRHTALAVDLTEQIAGKSALQEAAANLAARILPKLVEPAKTKGKAEK